MPSARSGALILDSFESAVEAQERVLPAAPYLMLEDESEPSIEGRNMTSDRRSSNHVELRDALKSFGREASPEELFASIDWSKRGDVDPIDAFYSELSAAYNSGWVMERRTNSHQIALGVQV